MLLNPRRETPGQQAAQVLHLIRLSLAILRDDSDEL